MEEVAAQGRSPYRHPEVLLEEIPEDLQQKFLNVHPGDILEPIAHGDGFHLCRVVGKAEPDVDGDFFGELSILNGSPRAASVEANSDCQLLALEPEAVRELKKRFPEKRIRSRMSTAIFRKRSKRIRKIVPIEQIDEMDGGAASLGMVAR